MKSIRDILDYKTETLKYRTSDLMKVEDKESECVADLSYDLPSETLTIVFMARGTYEYYEFPVDEYANFNAAGSRGTYFNLYIRDKYPYGRVA